MSESNSDSSDAPRNLNVFSPEEEDDDLVVQEERRDRVRTRPSPPRVAQLFLDSLDGKLDFYALVLDMSQTGCRLVLPSLISLKPGAEFQVEIQGQARRKAQVVWSKTLDGDVAKAGVTYL